MSITDYLQGSAKILDEAANYAGSQRVDEAVGAMVAAVRAGAPILVCGNGGSASDAMHISGELVGRFLRERRAINCICLSSNPAVLTAWSNDYAFETVFARQVEAYGAAGGVLIGLSTSGNSANIIAAFETASAAGMTTVAFTGQGGGKLAAVADVLIDVPSRSTPMIQQVHICLYHYLCEQVEAALFPDA
ncbi:phosphoheptose isomerase [Devosia insulae DS-56]|uniref:Phosphoheptose isomerase n=1 Tax=Devosia insulae DS-56 TaxID=1116389 RepID=A0A1E5XM68_9HYPH|nr:SIS domain-containing protein [Devosia insulae]OEO29665.1 phosphoheptose isomerase [Devosia insulae DS-56]